MAVNKYECMMVFSLKDGEEKAQSTYEKFKSLIESNGTLDGVDEWGKRKLAYPINDEPDGYYVLVNFSSEPEFPAELDRVFNITEGVLRTMILSKD